MPQNKLRIGTRGSQLALWQANWVKGELERFGFPAEIVVIHTSGDQRRKESIANIGATGVFTKEIQAALLDNRVDLAVHSMKDLPTEKIPGLILAAVPNRADTRDLFISPKADRMEDLPDGSLIGTGSLRRRCQLLHRYGDRFRIEEIRGNVETRLAKLDSGDYDGVILAVAGLSRLGFGDRIRETAILAAEEFFPAIGQGALAIEAREGDSAAIEAVSLLDNPEEHARTTAERSLLLTLEGGCIAPIGACSTLENGTLTLRGRILSVDGKEQFDAVFSSPSEEAEKLGRLVAQKLLDSGADKIIDSIRNLRKGSR